MLDALPASGLDAGEPERRAHPRCYGIPRDHRTGWIVAHTHPQAERWADTNLRLRGYRTYLPLVRIGPRERPLFTSYLFVHYDSRDPRRPIRETPGVRDLIRCGSQIQWCPEGAVEAVQAAVALAAQSLGLKLQWAPGAAVSLANGIFAGHPAVILKVGKDMALVSLLLFGELREVAVQLDCLRARDE